MYCRAGQTTEEEMYNNGKSHLTKQKISDLLGVLCYSVAGMVDWEKMLSLMFIFIFKCERHCIAKLAWMLSRVQVIQN